MVYRSRPITKFCCSDTPEREVRIIAIFSIVSTCFCLFLIFLAFANLVGQREAYQRSSWKPILNSSSCNDSSISGVSDIASDTGTTAVAEINSNCTATTSHDVTQRRSTVAPSTRPTPKSKTTTMKPSKKSKKEPSQTTLDWICRLLLWERNVETFWILLPCFWNLSDVLRGLLLLHASTTKQPWLLKMWYSLTSANVLAGIIIFYPIFTNYTAGDLAVTFIVIYIILIFYNCYSLWIVSVFLKEIRMVGGGITPRTTTTWSSAHALEEMAEYCESTQDQVQRF